MPLRPAAGEHVFDGHVDEGGEARAGRLRTPLDELVANVLPPADFVPSAHLQRDVTYLGEKVAGGVVMRAYQSPTRAAARCRSARPTHADERGTLGCGSAMTSDVCSRRHIQQRHPRRRHHGYASFLLLAGV